MSVKKFFTRKKVIIFSLLISLFSFALISYESQDFEIVKNLDIYYTLFRELNLFYVDEIDPGKIVKTSIDGMLESLDPYTVYIPESRIEDYKFMTTGQYGGVGAVIRKDADYVIIAEPYANFPIAKAGLRAGDIIKKIDGQSVKGRSTKEISEILKGEPNTDLLLTIKRPYKEDEFDVKITRQKIKIKSVPYYGMIDSTIGYISLTGFTQNASKEVKKALVDLTKNKNMKSLVFDLRGNPGGLLMEAVNICNLFIDKGTEIVSTRGKAKQWDRTYKTTFSAVNSTIPVVVLVNRGSASASEIVSGTFQDIDRGVIIGKRTFGKGLVQATRPLSYNSKLKVTTAKYYIPSGRCIQALDYAHRNEDGSVGKMPDSLITQFKTKNGRKVYDGGGIVPDIKTESEVPGNITISLIQKNLLFNYATKYRNEHDSILSAKNFKFDESDFEKFKTYLADKKYDYITHIEKTIKKLIKIAKKEKYYNDISGLIDSINSKLVLDKSHDIEKFHEQIEELLKEEIVSRYYYQEGRIVASFDYDKELETAIEVLKNPKKYKAILDGTYTDKSEDQNN